MKKRDIIIVTVCIATALICIVLTFWGNLKNNGVLTIDSFIGIIATLIGICATIVVGFQIASFVKIHETERQIKEVKEERDKMQKEKEELQKSIDSVELELSNAFIILAKTTNNNSLKIIARMLSISCTNPKKDAEIILTRYSLLQQDLKKASSSEIAFAARLIDKIKTLHIPDDIEHYIEIMKLHVDAIEILEKAAAEEEKKKKTKQTK